MKYLIQSSDDFGMCHSINTGTVHAVQSGVLTQSTLMAPCPWFEEAAALAKEHDIPCGVHLVTTCEWDRYRWRPLTDARSFVESDGAFSKFIHHVQDHADRGELEAELSAQIELVMSRGIRVTHLDSHMGVADAGVLANLCRKYRLRSRGDMVALDSGLAFPFASPVACFSDRPDVASKKRAFRDWLNGLTDGCHFVIWHAGQASDELASLAARSHPAWSWAQLYRATDLEVLCDPEIRALCRDLGIAPATLRDGMPISR